MSHRKSVAAAAAVLMSAGCAGVGIQAAGPSAATVSRAPAPASASVSASPSVDLTALRLGDGHVSTSPAVGDVYSCQQTFGDGGGARGDVPWISGSTWNSRTKPHVRGNVRWADARHSMTVTAGRRLITTNDLPTGHGTGVFPIASNDPAYTYDRNPNSIVGRSVTLSLPANPTVAGQPSCVGMGAIGVLDDGVYLFNALDGGGRDAAAHEVLDSCDGHPERSGDYHHHTVPSCILAKATGTSTLVGYALDGFGIYVERHRDGSLLTNAELDACHGRTSSVRWDGRTVTMYHYVATAEYPYTVGCYRGTTAARPT